MHVSHCESECAYTHTVGALTKNIMAMKERLEGDLPQEEQTGLPIITEAQRRKEREMVTKEVCVFVCVCFCVI